MTAATFVRSPCQQRAGQDAGRMALIAMSVLGLLAAVPPAFADAAAGKTKAATCSGCHGPVGIAAMPGTPNLAGQPEDYLVTQLRAYKSGARKHEVMTLMAQPLSDADIADLAAWYSSIKVEAKAP